jgi:hypothetical protein
MEFVLRYQGPLPTCSRSDSRAKEKQFIRTKLSPQLRDWWETHPGLKNYLSQALARQQTVKGSVIKDPIEEPIVPAFGHVLINGWKFVPLVVRSRRWICELKIVFLRRHDPGDIVRGGDIDNRLKTLFDALRIPYDAAEVSDQPAKDDQATCFCLLEDDALITSISIDTERLLGPLSEGSHDSDVDILLRVVVKTYNRSLGFT